MADFLPKYLLSINMINRCYNCDNNVKIIFNEDFPLSLISFFRLENEMKTDFIVHTNYKNEVLFLEKSTFTVIFLSDRLCVNF